jgi:hypothetical protein
VMDSFLIIHSENTSRSTDKKSNNVNFFSTN